PAAVIVMVVWVPPALPGAGCAGVGAVGWDVEEPPQASAMAAEATSVDSVSVRTAFMMRAPSAEKNEGSVELPRDVESEVPIRVGGGAAGDVGQRQPERVREVDLEYVPSDDFLHGERLQRLTAESVQPRRVLAGEVKTRDHAEPRADAEGRRVSIRDVIPV